MPKKSFIKKEIEKTKDGNFGKYRESTGGGHPFPLGSSNTRTTRDNGKIRQAQNDTNQPRTDDGKFTYNSVNGKPLKDISKKKGKSRGFTVPPVLTGGVNGIAFKNGQTNRTGKRPKRVDFNNEEDRQERWLEWSKNHQWYDKGAEVISFEGKIKLSPERLEVIAQEYIREDKKKRGPGGEFKGENIENWGQKKYGRRANTERETIEAQAKKGAKGGRFVKASDKEKKADNRTGISGTRHFGEGSSNVPKSGKFTKKPQPAPTPQPQPQKQPQKQPVKSKYTNEDIEDAKNQLQNQGFDISGLSNEDISELIDEYFA